MLANPPEEGLVPHQWGFSYHAQDDGVAPKVPHPLMDMDSSLVITGEATHAHRHAHTHTQTQAHTDPHTYTHTCTHTYACTHTHTYTHTKHTILHARR